MFIPHLTATHSKCFALITHICHVRTSIDMHYHSYCVQLSSPKEMCLVLMEQLQISSSTTKLTLLLPLLQSGENKLTCSPAQLYHIMHLVLLKVKSQVVVNSSLSDFRSIIKRHIIALKQQYTKTEQASDSTDEEEEEGLIVTTGVTRVSFTRCVLEFLSPFIQKLHDIFCQAEGRVDWYGWSPLQQHCVSVLLDLLEYPVDCLRKQEIMEEEDFIDCIMKEIVRCHCGCLQLLEWRNLSWRRRKDESVGDEEEPQGMNMSELYSIMW